MSSSIAYILLIIIPLFLFRVPRLPFKSFQFVFKIDNVKCLFISQGPVFILGKCMNKTLLLVLPHIMLLIKSYEILISIHLSYRIIRTLPCLNIAMPHPLNRRGALPGQIRSVRLILLQVTHPLSLFFAHLTVIKEYSKPTQSADEINLFFKILCSLRFIMCFRSSCSWWAILALRAGFVSRIICLVCYCRSLEVW